MKHALILKGMSECALAKVRHSQSYNNIIFIKCAKWQNVIKKQKSDVAIIIEDNLKYAITLTSIFY